MNIWKAGLFCIALSGLAGCIVTPTAPVNDTAPMSSTSAPSVSRSSDGGAEVRYASGCFIAYDSAANRGGHAGSCTNQEFARADQEAARFLGGSAPANVASDDLSAFQGARAGQAEGGLRARGYELVRTEGLTAYWFNRGTGSCARIVTSDGRYSSVTMVPAGRC